MTLRESLGDFNRGLDDAAQGVEYPDTRETIDYLEGYAYARARLEGSEQEAGPPEPIPDPPPPLVTEMKARLASITKIVSEHVSGHQGCRNYRDAPEEECKREDFWPCPLCRWLWEGEC